eukprot:gene11108-3815_t
MEHITEGDLMSYTKYPKTYAASLLGISLSDLSRLCKKFGIRRWPYHTQRRDEDCEDGSGFHNFKVNSPKKKLKTKDNTIKLDLSYILDSKASDYCPNKLSFPSELVSVQKLKHSGTSNGEEK